MHAFPLLRYRDYVQSRGFTGFPGAVCRAESDVENAPVFRIHHPLKEGEMQPLNKDFIFERRGASTEVHGRSP